MDRNTLRNTRRKNRIRRRLKASNANRPRLSVFRSKQHIYAQLIDDEKRCTVAAASTLEKAIAGDVKSGGNIQAAEIVGKAIGERAVKAGVKEVVFDRGDKLYHGRVKALADAARAAGLSF